MVETYKKEILVTEPETDITKRMTLSNIMRHSQQMGSEHIASMGIDYNRMYRDGMVFLVNKMLITIDRRPVFGEELLLTTIPRKPKGAQFIRDTIFETRAGEKLIEVSISWMLVSPDTHKILRPSVFDVYGFEMFPNEGEYITGYRIRRPEAETVTHLAAGQIQRPRLQLPCEQRRLRRHRLRHPAAGAAHRAGDRQLRHRLPAGGQGRRGDRTGCGRPSGRRLLCRRTGRRGTLF